MRRMWCVLTPCEQGTTTASIRGREQIAQDKLARIDDKSIAQPIVLLRNEIVKA